MKGLVVFAWCVLLCGNYSQCEEAFAKASYVQAVPTKSSQGAAPTKSSQGTEQQLDLCDLPKLVRDLVSCHPGKRALDEEVLLKSHEKLFSLFDPDKSYLLMSEAAPFVDPQNGPRFLKEYQRNDFSTYYTMLNICREAVARSRTIRKGFFFTDTNTLDKIRNKPPCLHDRYALDRDELTARLFQKYARLIVERLPIDGETDRKQVESAVELAEKELEAHESGWLRLDTRSGAPKDKRSSAARLILKTILSALDTHSDVMGQKASRTIRERLTKEAFGTGVVPGIDDEGCFVKKIIRGSPADHPGTIQVNDRITALDGRPCSQMTEEEIENVLNGETRAIVQCTLRRATARGKNEKTLTAVVSRSSYTMLEGRVEVRRVVTPEGAIGIITLHAFYRGGPGISSSEDVKRALLEASSQGLLSGVILDLRDNGGGYISEAVRVVGQFIKTGVVMTACYADGSRLVFRDVDPDIAFAGPVVVLTSKATASAAEIVAQALKDYGRAIIVGDPQTYGKGSIQMQTVTDIGEKGAWVNVPMRFTVGRFYTVSGYSPQVFGVKADIIVPGLLDRPKAAEEDLPDPRLKDRIDPLFHDSLEDVSLEVKGWYQDHYLPFVQERADTYRRLIPLLQKKSELRMKKNPLRSILNQRPVLAKDREELKEKADELQMQEAIAIEQDLIAAGAHNSG